MPIDLGPNSLLGNAAPTLKKPSYLIKLEDAIIGKTRSFQYFISLDKPRVENGLVEVKGFFCERSEEEIIKTFSEILTSFSKELTIEVTFPLHRIYSMRNLVFNAVKSITTVNPGKL